MDKTIINCIISAFLAAIIAGCSNGNGSHTSDAVAEDDDWHLNTKHDVISETDALHLVTVVPSAAGDKLRLQIDLSCPIAGTIKAELLTDDLKLVWGSSLNDIAARGLLGAIGIASNPVSTEVQWRIGQLKKSAMVRQGKYANVATIDDFFSLSGPSPWTGSLAVAVVTDHGELSVEQSIDTPNARTFLKRCESNLETAKAQNVRKAAEEQAAAKVAAATAKANALMEVEAKDVVARAVDKSWPACGDFRPFLITVSYTFFQMRSLKVQVNSTKTSAAERASGYEWKGNVDAYFDQRRSYDRQSKNWGEWASAYPFTECGEMKGQVWVRNGKWDASIRQPKQCQGQDQDEIKHVSCSEAPPE